MPHDPDIYDESERLLCDSCGHMIEKNEDYYAMPDGDIICEDCLEAWLSVYKEILR